MWAFVIYDKIQSVLFISRDRFGKKPLYDIIRRNHTADAGEILNSITTALEHFKGEAALEDDVTLAVVKIGDT